MDLTAFLDSIVALFLQIIQAQYSALFTLIEILQSVGVIV